jgi:osmotically-inducible protein OsmY
MATTVAMTLLLSVSTGLHANPPKANADNTELNQRDADNDTLTPLDQSNSKADTDIVAKIRSALTDEKSLSINAQNVKVIVREGVVTLRGPVANAEEKKRIAAIAKGIPGVRSVTNEIDVKS